MIHDPKDYPEMNEKSLKLSPGNEYSLSTSLTVTKLLGRPYGKCNTDPNYRQGVCLFRCFSDYIANECQCRSPDLQSKYAVCSIFKNNVFLYL